MSGTTDISAVAWRPFEPSREACARAELERDRRPRRTLTAAARARLDAVIARYRQSEVTS